MTAEDSSPTRIASLDILRGVAVMGILAMNIVAFAMPVPAYMNPMAFGTEGPADIASWSFSFVFIDGKMRGLFSFLFGASMLLVAERADAAGKSPSSVTYRRLAWLLLFGLIHFYFIWFGDILAAYALTGMVAWRFRSLDARSLIMWGAVLIALQLAIFMALALHIRELSQHMAAPHPSPEIVEEWRGFTEFLAVQTAAELRHDLALHLGSWWGLARDQLTRHTISPLVTTLLYGPETLAYMLLGMAGLKNGFLMGSWDRGRYRRTVLTGLAIAVPAYAVLAALIIASGFSVPALAAFSIAATTLFRPPMIIAYAALILLLTRLGGALVERIAAAGRAAFSNYLGTSLLMTALFYGWGLGLYGSLSRVQLWLVVIPAWALMLAWSKPWLHRFRYGPLEWLWRSLARGEWQEMKRLPRHAELVSASMPEAAQRPGNGP